MKIYVGNLPWSVTDSSLEAMFAAHGEVNSASVISDRETGRSRGFGFVEMSDSQEAQQAISALNGHSIESRELKVNEALDKPRRASGY